MLTGQVFVWLKPVADEWQDSKLAYFLLWMSVIVVSFPPLIGWSTMGTISGYLFGVWKGYVIARKLEFEIQAIFLCPGFL